MSMLMPVAATKFTDANPGSQIRVTSVQGNFPPYEARVLEMRPEYGQNRVPALVVLPGGESDPRLLISSGETRIEILINSNILQQNTPPHGAYRVRTIPREYLAARFNGGVESASSLIGFTAGKVAMRWEQQTDQYRESLIITRADREDRCEVGDFLIVGDITVTIVEASVVAEDYEMIGEPVVSVLG